ncbi:MAG: putative nucleotidyltransferase [Glaciecola sp.]|jgi:predicted nucleotidyltransferase
MLKNQIINLKIIEKVASTLGELNNDVIYVGGAVVSLYVTDKGAEQPRPTKDIDISVQISTYAQMDLLRIKLAEKRIFPSASGTVMYRYQFEDILLDFIPYEETPLGPTNSWLKPGFKKAYPVTIGNIEIKILPVSLFLATKWEAFKSRGNDPRTSHDFEDIIYIIDNNLNLVDDALKADKNVQVFLKEMSNEIMLHSNRNEIIESHLNPYTRDERREIVINKLERILEIK